WSALDRVTAALHREGAPLAGSRVDPADARVGVDGAVGAQLEVVTGRPIVLIAEPVLVDDRAKRVSRDGGWERQRRDAGIRAERVEDRRQDQRTGLRVVGRQEGDHARDDLLPLRLRLRTAEPRSRDLVAV